MDRQHQDVVSCTVPVAMSLMIITRAGLPPLDLMQVDEASIIVIGVKVLERSSVEHEVVMALAALAEVSDLEGLHPGDDLSAMLHVLVVVDGMKKQSKHSGYLYQVYNGVVFFFFFLRTSFE